jgi:hypothetical protein
VKEELVKEELKGKEIKTPSLFLTFLLLTQAQTCIQNPLAPPA